VYLANYAKNASGKYYHYSILPRPMPGCSSRRGRRGGATRIAAVTWLGSLLAKREPGTPDESAKADFVEGRWPLP